MTDTEKLEAVANLLWSANEELFGFYGHAEMASILSKAIVDALDVIEGDQESKE